MPIILANALFIAIVAVFGLRYILSFELAFLGTLAVAYSSYRSILGRIEGLNSLEKFAQDSPKNSPQDLHEDSPQDSTPDSPQDSHPAKDSKDSKISSDSPAAKNAPPTPDNLPKKARFLLGIRASFGVFRLLSYGFIVLSAVALINNGAFFVAPFLLGVLCASVAIMAACALRA